jgi:hypothetical protein
MISTCRFRSQLVVLALLLVPGYLWAQEPGIEIVSAKLEGTTITLIFQTDHFDFPAENHAVHAYFDNDFIQRELTANQLELQGTSGGEHAVVLVLAEGSSGHYLELQNPTAVAAKIVRLELPCEGPGDPACDDGNPCSLDMCNQSGPGYLCEYGVTPQGLSCCTSDYQCTDGKICLDYECAGCTINAQCDDGNECTVNRCEEGICRREVVAGCCTMAGSCDDNDPCTAEDRCLDGTCAGSPIACPEQPDCADDICPSDSTTSGQGHRAGSGCLTTGTSAGQSWGSALLLLLGLMVGILYPRRQRTIRSP